MKNLFARYLSAESWLIKEESWTPRLQGVREAQFSLGNGYLGSRGVLEEIPYNACPGTYIAGLYDNTGAQVTELVNLPNPVDFRIVAEGEKLGVAAMDILEHRRILDMKKGLLIRRTLYRNSREERFDYQSLRFFSMDDLHLAVMQVYFTPLDSSVDIVVQATVDTSVTNKGILTEGRKRHFQVTELVSLRDVNYVCVETFEGTISVGFATHLRVDSGKKEFGTNSRAFPLKVEKNQTVCFTRIISFFSSRDTRRGAVKTQAVRILRRGAKKSFAVLLNQHIKAWDKLWRSADITIRPQADLTRALRFNIYHLLICGNEKNPDVSIAARTLSGEGYRGHIFWDAEIFILPFFLYTNPGVARNLLSYRYRRLDRARRLAREKGFAGACFPWESADKGEEAAPPWDKSLDGRIIKIRTMEMEQHITGDIAYAVYHYYQATGDEDFMLKQGLELMFETARFWASRVRFSKRENAYQINHVIGPDEFHEDVNNNAYTNTLARWNLMRAYELYQEMRFKRSRRFRRLIARIRLNEKEVRTWLEIASRIVVPRSRQQNLIEAFDGYFKKEDIPITELDKNFMPVLPRAVLFKDIRRTQLIKQPDTVMLTHLLADEFSPDQREKAFFYYDKRTLHKSSLSLAVSTIAALDAGDFTKAHRYFLAALYCDLKNLHGNTAEGVHAASLGGIWQAVINGICGIRIREGILSFDPRLPGDLKVLKFLLKYRQCIFRISVYQKSISVEAISRKKDRIKLRVYNRIREVFPNERILFKRP